MRRIRGCVASGAVSLAVAMVLGTAASAAETAGNLDEVEVTGQRLEELLPQQLAEFGVKVETVTAEQIRHGGYVDVASALQALVPGLYVESRSGPFDYVDISLHGSRRQDVLWLVDGIRINNRLYGGTTPLDTIPASMVERIEVLYGGQALFYGTQAPAGAVNIVTKEFTLAPNGAVSLGGDTNAGWHVDGDFRNAVGKNQFVLFASYDESSGYQPFRDSDIQPSLTDDNRSYDMLTLGAKYAYEFSEQLRLETLVQHNEGSVDFLYSPAALNSVFNDRNENLVSAKVDYTVSHALQFFVKGYGHWWDSHYTEIDNVVGSPGDTETYDDHDYWGYRDYGLNAMGKARVSANFDLLFGYDFQAYSGSDAVLVITRKSEHVNALFAQIRNTPALWPKAHLSAGVRFNDPSFGESATVWNVSGQFDFTDSVFGRLSGGTSFRLPTAEELFADDPNDERGNPDLKPETSEDLNVSLGGHLGGERRYEWELTGFLRKVKNLIAFDDFDEDTNQDVAINTDAEVKVKGIEVDFKAPLGAGFNAGASYTYNEARNAGTDLQINRVPVSQAKAALDYSPGNQRLGATLTANYVGSIYNSVAGVRQNYGDYVLVDLAGRVYLDEARHSVITARIENLFDEEYAAAIGNSQLDSDGSNFTFWFRGVPRTFSLRYSYRF